MGIIENIKEAFRYEIPRKQEIVDREEKMSNEREKWLLNYISLYKGSLKEFNNDKGYSACFPIEKKSGFSKQPQKVMVQIKKRANEQIAIQKLEKALKFEIFYRGCDLGVDYKKHEMGKYLVGEATPAIRRGSMF